MRDIILKEVELLFPSLFTQDPKYGKFRATLRFSKERPDGAAIEEAALVALTEATSAVEAKKKMSVLKGEKDFVLRDGDKRAAMKENAQNDAGNWIVVATSKSRPLLLDRRKAPITEAANNPFTFGATVNAHIRIGYNKENSKVYAALVAMQFVSGGHTAADPSLFEEYPDEQGEDSALADLL